MVQKWADSLVAWMDSKMAASMVEMMAVLRVVKKARRKVVSKEDGMVAKMAALTVV